MNRGFSVIELMVAMGILSLVLTAVVITSFGDQAFLTGSQTSSEALIKAQGALEAQQALARKDFNLVAATSSSDGFFTTSLTVDNPVNAGKADYLTKSVKATVSWTDERGIARNLALTTLIGNFTNVAGANTCNSSPQGNWLLPAKNTYLLTGLVPGLVGSYPITALDAYQDKLYVGAGPTTLNGDRTFFIFNLTNGVPTFVAGSALDTSGTASAQPPSALVVAATSTSGRVYAYIANGVSPDWSNSGTCAIASDRCSQLEVVDVTSAGSPTIVKYVKFATSTKSTPNLPPYVTGTGGQGAGKSIFYKNGYIFLGLAKTGTGPEFHVIDVHNPLNPISVGSTTIGRSVNAIFVRGSFAYLATDDNTAGNNNILTILDLTDPANPKKVWANPITSSLGVGNAVTAVGDKLYFATTYNNATPPEYFVFNNANPSSAAPTQITGASLPGTLSAKAMIVRDYLAYVLTSTNSLQMLSSLSGAPYGAAIPLAGNGSAMDCEGNNVYVGTSDSAGTILQMTGS